MEHKKINVMGVSFDAVTFYEAGMRIRSWMTGDRTHYVVTPNAVMLEYAQRDECFCRVLCEADLCVADGVGVMKAAALLKTPLPEQIPGVELGEALLPLCAKEGWRVFFFGGQAGVAEQAAQKMMAAYPGLSVVGCADGYINGQKETASLVERINASGAQLLFVCLGSPKQEFFIKENIGRFSCVRAALALGGTLDVLGGRVPRAPKAFRKSGLEWLYRMLRTPEKLGRSGDLLRFVCRAVGEASAKKRAGTK